MTNIPRPLHHLNTASSIYPSAWKQVETMLSGKGKDLPDWPAWCFLPMAGWYAIVSEGIKITDIDVIGDVGRLSAIGTWRYTQGIYRFDPDTYKALIATVLLGDIPANVLMRLPEWSLYIETPDMQWLGTPLHGFWAHLEWDVNKDRKELRLLLDTGAALIPIPLHIGDWPLTEAVSKMAHEAAIQAKSMKNGFLRNADSGQQIADMIQPLIALILYICSDEPEIDDERKPGTAPKHPAAKKVKGVWRWFPPDKPRIWTIGKQIGAKLREVHRAAGGSHTVKPHIRRAHWHGFWKGSKKGERSFFYHWLPPILVTGNTASE